MDPRPLPVKTFEYSGLVPSTQTTINSPTTYITNMTLSNIDSSNHTVTFRNGAGTTKAAIVIASNDVDPHSFPDGWDFVSGISIQCDAPSVVQIQIFGYQNYL